MSFELVGVRLVAENGDQYFATMAKADKAVSTFGDTNKNVFSQMPGLSDIAVGALRKIGEVAVDAFAKAGAAAVGFIKDSVTAAGEFQDGMLEFQAVAGKDVDATGLKDFHDLFLQLGKDLPVSTKEVQDAAIEMVKGGIEPATVAAGGLEQALKFATATGISLSDAAETSAKIIGGWSDVTATAADKADLLTHSTDLLTKAANASVVGVEDLSLGLYNVQGTAKTAGLSLDETVTALAEIAPRFSNANTAGTSFRNFLVRLQPSTKPAIEAMIKLGLASDDGVSRFYDAKGAFIGVAQASQLLQNATKDLTDAQKTQALQTIFGNDAMNAAAAFAELGAKGYDNMTASLEKANGVSANAALRQQSLTTLFKNFQGTVEVIQIKLGEALIPVLTDLFTNVLQPGINTLADLAGALLGDQMAFDSLSPAMQAVALAAEGIWASISTLIDFIENNAMPIINTLIGIALYTLVPAFAAWATGATTAGAATVAAMLPVIAPIAAIGAAIFVLTKAWQEDWFGIATAVTDFWETTGKPIFDALVGWLSVEIPAAIKVVSTFWTTTLLPALTAVWNFISTKVIPIVQSLVGTHFASLNASVQGVATFWNTILLPALTAVWNFIDQHVIPLLEALAKVFTAVVGVAAKGLADKFNNELLPGIRIVSDFINEHVLPDWDNVKRGMEIVGNFIEQNISPIIKSFIDDVLKGWSEWFGTVAQGIDRVVGWLDKLADAINSLPSLPDPLTGHSPPPMAKWMRAIADETAYAANALNATGSAIRGIPPSPMAVMAAGGNTNNYSQQRTVNLNYNTTYAPPASTSLAIANALA